MTKDFQNQINNRNNKNNNNNNNNDNNNNGIKKNVIVNPEKCVPWMDDAN